MAKRFNVGLDILTVFSVEECALDRPVFVPVSFERIN
jgi:hypothetical protein